MEEKSIDMEKLYNSELKSEYFDKRFTNKNTKNTAYFDFLTISRVEKDSHKDAYAFNDLDIATVLKSMESSSVLSIRRLLSSLNDYVRWCIENGKRGNDETFTNSVQEFIDSESNLDKYVSNKKIQGKILEEDQFDDLLNILINPMDTALVLCLYNFVSGRELYEIRSLTRDSIDVENNQLHLKNRDENGEITTRTQKISQQLVDELLLLNTRKTYITNNGVPDSMGRIRELTLVESKYLFKPTKSNKTNAMMSVSSLYTRIRQIKQDTGYNFISPTSLRDTRLIHEILKETKAREAYEPTQEIIHDVLDEMYDTYGLSFSHMQLYSLEQKITKLLHLGKFV